MEGEKGGEVAALITAVAAAPSRSRSSCGWRSCSPPPLFPHECERGMRKWGEGEKGGGGMGSRHVNYYWPPPPLSSDPFD